MNRRSRSVFGRTKEDLGVDASWRPVKSLRHSGALGLVQRPLLVRALSQSQLVSGSPPLIKTLDRVPSAMRCLADP